VSLDAYAVSKQTTVGDDHHLTLSIPMLSDADYQPHLILHSATIWREFSINKSDIHNGKLELKDLSLQGSGKQTAIQPINADKPEGFQ
jgi:hypothetical protein